MRTQTPLWTCSPKRQTRQAVSSVTELNLVLAGRESAGEAPAPLSRPCRLDRVYGKQRKAGAVGAHCSTRGGVRDTAWQQTEGEGEGGELKGD